MKPRRIQRKRTGGRLMPPRTEFGSIEGEIADATTHYGAPAIRIRERLTSAEVICVLPRDLADTVGREHNWLEIWSGRRVLVTGEISYRKDGLVSRVGASDIFVIDPRPLSYSDLADPTFTNGLSPPEHIARLWSEDRG